MRIAFVTPEYVSETQSDGGLANYLQRVSLSLLQLGHQPVVIVSSNEDACIRVNGVEVQRVKIRFGFLLRLLDYLTFRQYTTLLALLWQSHRLNKRVAQIHASDPLSMIQYPHLAAVGFFRPSGIPAIIRLSGYQSLWQQEGDGSTDSRSGRQQLHLETRTLKAMSAIFGPSRLINAYVGREIGREITTIETPFVLDTKIRDESIYRKHLEGKKYLLFFGQLVALKGVLEIAEILDELLGRHPDLHFVFIGKQNQEVQGQPVMSHIQQKAGTHKDRVQYLGVLRHEQLYPVIENSYAVVLPSRIDNFPNTCIEAMALKGVVIGTQGTSFEQLIEHGKSGFLCEPKNPQSLLQTIEKALSLSPEERKAIALHASRRIEELKPEKVVVELLNFYRRIIDAKMVSG